MPSSSKNLKKQVFFFVVRLTVYNEMCYNHQNGLIGLRKSKKLMRDGKRLWQLIT